LLEFEESMMTDSNKYLRPIPFSCLALAFACAQPPPPGAGSEDSVGVTLGEETSGAPDDMDGTDGDNTTMGDPSDGETGTEAGVDMGDTDTGADTSDTEPDPDPLAQSLYPLVDGAKWSYIRKTTAGQILGMELTEANEIEWEGEQAFEIIDEPDDDGEWNASVLLQDGDLVTRVHREEMDNLGTTAIIDYDPGFLRVSEAFTVVGPPQEFLYDRTAYDGNGQNPSVEARGHTFEVLAVGEQVTVPAGTFDCVKVERVRTLGAEAGALVWFWFAPGVGKVREERPLEMEVEELVSVSIPGVIDLP
jgi:hypothetical protein